ncbi:MAG: hypothetical protein P1U56_26090 [Saprospiraceae bacterium]|nr:hypothetical protein [Saprospiraceae bacterium]
MKVDNPTTRAFNVIEIHLENLKKYTIILYTYTVNRGLVDIQNVRYNKVNDYINGISNDISKSEEKHVSQTGNNMYTKIDKFVPFPFDELNEFYTGIKKSYTMVENIIRPVYDSILKNRLDLYQKSIGSIKEKFSLIETITKGKEKQAPYNDILFFFDQLKNEVERFYELLFPTNGSNDLIDISEISDTGVLKFHLFQELGLFDFLVSEYNFKNKDTKKLRKVIEKLIGVNAIYQKEILNNKSKIKNHTKMEVQFIIDLLQS